MLPVCCNSNTPKSFLAFFHFVIVRAKAKEIKEAQDNNQPNPQGGKKHF
jgi:hypothetical protein